MAQENGTNGSSGGSSTGNWVIIAVVAIVALGVILWIMNRDGSDDGSAPPNPTEVVTAPVIDLPTPAPGVPQCTATTEVNIRSGPGTDFPTIGLMQEGQSVAVNSRTEDSSWWMIDYPAAENDEGWVSSEFVVASNTENVPVAPLSPPSQPTPPPSGVPQAVISGPTQAIVGESVTFGAENSVAVTGTQITEVQWDLGDGTQATGGTVTHIYQTAGSYNVDLTVTDSAGQTGASTHVIEVVADVPTPEEGQLPAEDQATNSAEGIVTYLSDSLQGAMTASGVPYDKDAMVAAHKDLPLGTLVTVTNLFNGKSVVVEIVDRSPPTVTALIDVSSAAARELDMTESGMVDGRIDW